MIPLIIVGVVLLIFLIWFYIHKKRLRLGNLMLITGGVKTGKTQLSVALVYKLYKRNLRRWRKQCRDAKRKFKPFPEKPVIYSNMPIGKPGMVYYELTPDLILQKTRYIYGSIIYINETSLVSGSKDIKNEDLNDALLKFYKLCAHETKGGYIILDTQSPQDCHYSIKRSLSTYLFIWRRVTLPFISFLWVRDCLLVDGENTIAIDSQIDPQDSTLSGGKTFYFLCVLNKWWKYYDQYAYSSLTDNLAVSTKKVTVKEDSDCKKIKKLLRCKDLLKGLKKDEK